jgi:molybdopterin/thiamine biosynthesis adenylyltransferase
VRLKKPVVSASILSFDGQISTFMPYEGPCYRCLYPTPPPPEMAPSCSENGVLGVMAGMMGLLQANEVMKLVLGIGEPLIGRLLLYEAPAPSTNSRSARSECLICGQRA